MAKRGFWWFTPFHHGHTIAEFRESHPTHAEILQHSINCKMGGLFKGILAGATAGYVMCAKLENRLFNALPSRISVAQTIVIATPIYLTLMIGGSCLGAHVGMACVKGKNPHEATDPKFLEADANFHDWLQKRAS